jgi:hypothetical protein
VYFDIASPPLLTLYSITQRCKQYLTQGNIQKASLQLVELQKSPAFRLYVKYNTKAAKFQAAFCRQSPQKSNTSAVFDFPALPVQKFTKIPLLNRIISARENFSNFLTNNISSAIIHNVKKSSKIEKISLVQKIYVEFCEKI